MLELIAKNHTLFLMKEFKIAEIKSFSNMAEVRTSCKKIACVSWKVLTTLEQTFFNVNNIIQQYRVRKSAEHKSHNFKVVSDGPLSQT